MAPSLRTALAAAISVGSSLVQAQDTCPPGFTRYPCNETDASLTVDDADWFSGMASISASLTWESCPSDPAKKLECAILRVPNDYSSPFAGLFLIDLPLVRHPSTKSGAKSIIVNYGGPGANGIESFVKGDGARLAKLYGDDYHWMTWDPRGTGLTTPFNCPADKTSISNTIDTPAGRRQRAQRTLKQSQNCAASPYKVQGTKVGTAFVARDVNRIFQALNEDGRIRYFGVSYGTLLGATIAAMFPTKVDRMILDANVDPDSYYSGLREDRGTDSDKALLNFFLKCAAAGEANCELWRKGKTGTQLRTTFYAFVNALKNKNYEAEEEQDDGTIETRRISYDGVKNKVFQGLYQPGQWRTLAATIDRYYTTAKEVKKRAAFEPKDSTEKELATNAIRCADWKWTGIGVNAANVEKLIVDWLPRFTSVSRFAGDFLINYPVSCLLWESKAREKYKGKWANIKTRNPVLLINGVYDPVTPLAAARELSQALVGSRVLVHTGAGHGHRKNPSTYVENSIKDYLKTGVLPDVSVQQAPRQSNPFVPVVSLAGADDLTEPQRAPVIDDDDDFIIAPEGDVPEGVDYPAALLKARTEPYLLPSLMRRQNSTSNDTSASYFGSLPSGCVEVPDICPGESLTALPPQEKNPEDWTDPDDGSGSTTVPSNPTTTVCPNAGKCSATPTSGVPDGYTVTTVYCITCPTPWSVITTKIPGPTETPTRAPSPGDVGTGGGQSSGAGRNGSAATTTPGIVKAGAMSLVPGGAALFSVLLGLCGYLIL